MSNILDIYKNLVPFLGSALGENCEVALLDCERKEIIAIANGHISGREIGAPMTDLAIRIVESGEWKELDYIDNYAGYAKDNKLLRSSSYFIKGDVRLYGMLCINVDTTNYQLISDLANMLGGLSKSVPSIAGNKTNSTESFQDNFSKAVSEILHEIYGGNVPGEFTKDERTRILDILDSRDAFLLKGSIPRAAKLFNCSDPTIYRELSKIRARKK